MTFHYSPAEIAEFERRGGKVTEHALRVSHMGGGNPDMTKRTESAGGTTIIIPFPPSMNHYWRRVGHKTLISAKGRRFRQDVADAVLECGCQRVDGRLDVAINLFPPDRRIRDVDNFCKAALDALQHCGIYDNDGQIDTLHVRRKEICKGGKAVIVITRIEVLG